MDLRLNGKSVLSLTVASIVVTVKGEMSTVASFYQVLSNSRLLSDALGAQLRRAHRAAKPGR